MPKAARERFTRPPAGTALAPMPRRVSGAGPLLSENRYVTISVTVVNIKVTNALSLRGAKRRSNPDPRTVGVNPGVVFHWA
mgnify:CR=1 FL=1